MGGPSGSTMDRQQSIVNQQVGTSQTQAGVSAADQAAYTQNVGYLQNFGQGILSGDPSKTNAATSAVTGPIKAGFEQSADQIRKNVPKGAAQDMALSQLPVQENTAVANVQNQTYLGMLQSLAGLGTQQAQLGQGAGQLGIGAGSAAAGANEELAKMQAAASPWNFIGSLMGMLGGAAGGLLTPGMFGGHKAPTHGGQFGI